MLWQHQCRPFSFFFSLDFRKVHITKANYSKQIKKKEARIKPGPSDPSLFSNSTNTIRRTIDDEQQPKELVTSPFSSNVHKGSATHTHSHTNTATVTALQAKKGRKKIYVTESLIQLRDRSFKIESVRSHLLRWLFIFCLSSAVDGALIGAVTPKTCT